jgi:hypothetical protein
MGNDSKEVRGVRLDAAFDQQANSQVKIEIVDGDFNPTRNVNISQASSILVPERENLVNNASKIAGVERGYFFLIDLGQHFQLGRLTPQDIQLSNSPKVPLHIEVDFKDLAWNEESRMQLRHLPPNLVLDTIMNYRKIDFEYHFVPKKQNTPGEIDEKAKTQAKAQTITNLKQGKVIKIVEVDFYDPKIHKKPFIVTLTQDSENPYRYRSEKLRIEKFEDLKLTIKNDVLSFIPEKYVAENIDPSLSADRFYVQIYDPSLTINKPISVKLTTQNRDSYQTKDSTTLLLYPVKDKPGFYRSKAMVLTSYPKVDQYVANGIADNRIGDPTVLGLPGDRVLVSYSNKNVSAEVPIKKVLPVKFYIFKDSQSKPIVDQKWMSIQIARLQNDLAPLGILVQAEAPVFLDSPLSIDTGKVLTLEQQALLSKRTTSLDPDFPGLRFIPAGDYRVDVEALGRAFYSNNSNASFIARDVYDYVITHEAVHHLTYNKQAGKYPANHDNKGHVISPKDSIVPNLMEAVLHDESATFIFHRISNDVISLNQDQIDAILTNPILQDPPQPTQAVQQTPTLAPTP